MILSICLSCLSVNNGAKILKTHESDHSVYKPCHNMAHSIHKPLGQWRGGLGWGWCNKKSYIKILYNFLREVLKKIELKSLVIDQIMLTPPTTTNTKFGTMILIVFVVDPNGTQGLNGF